MPKRNPNKKIFEDADIVPAEAHAKPTEPAQADAALEAPVPDSDEPGAQETPSHVESPVASEEAANEGSPDNILDDVRRALIEDEAHDKEQEQPKWWRRIGRGSRKS